MFGGKSGISLIIVISITSLLIGTGCGTRIKLNSPGYDFATVRYEITGSANIEIAEVTFCDYDLSETVYENAALPWTYEYTIDLYYPSFYYSVQGHSSSPVEKTAGTADRWNELTFEDLNAAFTQSSAADDYVYNSTDSVYGKITSVDSNTALTLDSICFAENKRTYKLYQSMNKRVSGISGVPESFKLVDYSMLFTAKSVSNGDKVYNTTTGASTTVDGAPEGNRLPLDDDIFPAAGHRYAVYNKDNEIYGTATAASPFQLIDGTKLFKNGTTPVSPGAVAARGAYHSFDAFAKVLSVDNETTLTLDHDIFADTDAYVIFNYDQDDALSTAQQANKLIDSSAQFYTGATTECIVYNPSSDSYANIASIDSSTILTLSADLFPDREIEYIIYANRFLTLSIYINDGLYKTLTSRWWNEVEVQDAGTILSQDLRSFLSEN